MRYTSWDIVAPYLSARFFGYTSCMKYEKYSIGMSKYVVKQAPITEFSEKINDVS